MLHHTQVEFRAQSEVGISATQRCVLLIRLLSQVDANQELGKKRRELVGNLNLLKVVHVRCGPGNSGPTADFTFMTVSTMMATW